MDGKGRCLDNNFIERLWRPLKYECVYLHGWETGSQAKAGVAHWIIFYNRQRPHVAYGGQPPAVVNYNQIEKGQQGQRAAQIAPENVQGSGSGSLPSKGLDPAQWTLVSNLVCTPWAGRMSYPAVCRDPIHE